jgi:hypothetical protein
MVGIYFATGATTQGQHWSGITGSRTDSNSHWGTQLNFYTHNNDVANLNDATQKMVIKGDGNVGIGETSPDTALDVVGGNADSVVDTLTLKNDNTGNSAGAGINFVVDGVNDVVTSAIYGQRTASAYHQGSLRFLTKDASGGGLLERMTIDSSGNVGINTTSPDSKLDVTGGDITVNTTGTGFMNFKYSGSQMGTIGTDGLDLKITANADLQLLPTGNVGIGETSPDRKLHVNSGSTNIVATFESTDATAAISLQDNSTTNDSKVQIRAIGDDFNIVAGGSQRVTVDSSGNVGIGTTDLGTEAKLAIGATNANEGGQIVLHKGTSGTYAAHLDAFTSGGSDFLRILKGTNTVTSAAPFYFDLTNDRLGIGTVPSSTLTLNATGGAALQWQYNTLNYLRIEADSGGGSYYAAAGFYHRFFTSGSERMRIDSSGNVDITGGGILKGMSHLELLNNGGSDGTATSPRIYSPASGTLAFSGNGSERMRIQSNGNVAIGNTVSDYGLLVEGTFAASNTGSCPDGCIYALTTASSQVNINVDTAIGPITAQSKLHIGQSATIGSNFTTAVNNSQLFVHKVGTNSDSNVIFAGGNTASTGGTGALSFGQNGQGYNHWVFYHKPISTNQSSVGSISSTSTATSYNQSGSDERLKKNITDWNENILDKFSDIQPKEFNFNSQEDTEDKIKGFIAQNEVDKFPEAYPLVYDIQEEEERHMFNPSGMVVYLMKAVQELKAEIEQLKTQINN